ncbi:GH25 family lysozyme [Convivina intestini]|uniref:Lysozyme n=1 Tax=Convivina intestini TaxID=1505726 RepID=A0A2U1DFB3_9LACO|nr:GH25 family lysozyme [Convivina intestini]PVY86360.1 GH25 family lysozyme M1 (1,4-beta-N-acetylmuramidase) [Convivina intestini]CAH1850673.1 hypothetical protein R077811_00138 [Convivina intestini]SDB82894.1 Lyzozyme M1 (1,4-beta-N-acetylmuramidase), GH25 family [Leuconostocaceae bacterium R-53105]
MKHSKNTKWHLAKAGKYLVNIGAAFSVLAAVAPLGANVAQATTKDNHGEAMVNNQFWHVNSTEQIQTSIDAQGMRHDMDHYVVQWGDTLNAIALAYGVDTNTLVTRYHLTNPDLIFAGYTLGQQAAFQAKLTHTSMTVANATKPGTTVAVALPRTVANTGNHVMGNTVVPTADTVSPQTTVNSQATQPQVESQSTTTNTNSVQTSTSAQSESTQSNQSSTKSQESVSQSLKPAQPDHSTESTQTSTQPSQVVSDSSTKVDSKSQSTGIVDSNSQAANSQSAAASQQASEKQTQADSMNQSTAASQQASEKQTQTDSMNQSAAASQQASEKQTQADSMNQSAAASQQASEKQTQADSMNQSTAASQQASLSVSQSASQQQSQLDSISQSQADVKWASQKSSESTSLSAADQQKHQQESQAAVNDYRSSVSASLADIKNHRSTPAIDVVDISSHNGHLSVQDFTRMKEQGVKAVIVKLTESTNYQNPYAQEQIQNAQAAGLAVGAYHYSHYNSGQMAHNEASYFADAADKYGLNKDTLMINDLEENDTKSSTVTADAANFNQTLKDRGYHNTAIYLNPTYQKETGINLSFVGNDRVWMAQYPYYPSSSDLRHGENGMWQWTSSATFAGVTGQFDGSILYNPSLFNGSGISTTGGNLHKAVTTSIEKFQEAGNHYVLEGTMTVNEVQNVNGLQQVRISELTADPFDWTDNGIPTVLLENTNGSNSFKVGDQVKFKAQYQRGNIIKYDTASNAIGIDYPQGVGIVWFDANKAWNHA